MERRSSNIAIPNTILTGDWHLREDIPICRTDDFWKAQWKKVDFVNQLQKKYDCPVLHSGDLFNHWKPSPFLLSETIKHLPDKFYTIYGNHDLPQHNLELAGKCGINVLMNAGKLTVIPTCHWGETPQQVIMQNGRKPDWSSIKRMPENFTFLVWHVMTYMKKPWPDCTDPVATKLLRQYPQYDLILTGHNHQAFWTKEEERLLVNPGSLTRQSSIQIEFQPRVYLWYAETNSVIPIFLPIQKDVITRDHIDSIHKRDERITSFVEQLKNEWDIGLSFEENLENFRKENDIDNDVMNIIYTAIDTPIK